MSPEYLPPLLASATAAVVASEYVAPVVPVVMVSPIHEAEEPVPAPADPAAANDSSGDAIRTAEVQYVFAGCMHSCSLNLHDK